MVYMMRAGLPPGDYLLDVEGGYQFANDAHIRADLALRAVGQPDVVLGSGEAVAGEGVDGGRGAMRLIIRVTQPIAARCGDRLVVIARMQSGMTPYLEFLATLTTP